MRKRRFPDSGFVAIQLIVAAAFAGSLNAVSVDTRNQIQKMVTGRPTLPPVHIEYEQPLRVEPLYDDPDVVSDAELAAVLEKIRPKFPPEQLKPNHVEHALRTWGIDATFGDPQVMSGVQMRDFLIDHSRYVKSWGGDAQPLLQVRPQGLAVRWGRQNGASVHHDHLLASLTEAGIPLSQPVYAPGRHRMTFNDMLQEALRDVRLDERETEWSTMAFGLWLPPRCNWTTFDGRRMSFNLLARRLLRGHKRHGVCSGTHRVYSLVLLVRLDEMTRVSGSPNAGDGLLSRAVLDEVFNYLEMIRDLISVSQFQDGHWPSNWYEGADAVIAPTDDEEYRKVIATGHHLEWLAIAPPKLHPSREQIRRAADWLIETTIGQSDELLLESYTFYSHVGNALALWRGTRPADFWREWQSRRPIRPE